jgi:hypothetical protein
MQLKTLFKLPLFTWLLPVVPVVHILSLNLERLSPYEVLWVLVPAMVGLPLIMLALRAVFKKPDITDLLVGIAFATVFWPILHLNAENAKLIWLSGGLCIALVVVLWRESRKFLPVILTVSCVALSASLLLNVVQSPVFWERWKLQAVAENAFEPLPTIAEQPAEKPDIYYLVFDRYQRADYLKSIYGLDNEPFLSALRQRGFVVSDESYSNYQRTAHSVVSSLNFDYLDGLSKPETKGKGDWQPLFSMFQDFRIGRAMKSFGYDVHFSGTWWEPTRRVAIADQHHNFYEMPEFPRLLYEYSLIVPAVRSLGLRFADPLYWQCKRSQLMFSTMREPKAGDKPIFYFAHFLIPHPPFVTRADGSCMTIAEAAQKSRSENYVGQLTYANAQILETVDVLLKRPGPKPIIILQADEGPWPEKFAGDEVRSLGRDVSTVDWATLDAETLREKMAIFSAIYAPKLPAGEIGPQHTPVNTFRKILKTYFNMPIEPLPDRNLIYLNNDAIYEFSDVTAKLRSP